MNVKKLSLAAVMLASAFGANAASPQIDFNIEATIPDSDFYVSALNGWDSQVQKMTWNDATSTLNTLSKQLAMKNTAGGIKAYLAAQPVLSGNESADVINLKIDIAGKTLPTSAASAVTLYTEEEAATEKTATMTVSALDLTARPAGGNYIGSVTMMFDTIAD